MSAAVVAKCMPSSRLLAVAVLAAALATTAPAHAYELHVTPDGQPTHWNQDRVVFRLSPVARERLGYEDLSRAVAMATEAWRGLPGSPDLVLGTGGGLELTEPDAHDGVNGIYVTDAPMEGDHLAETRLSFDPSSGRILDVDIVISGVDPWEVMTERSASPDVYDLGAILTHEMGHALGLSDEPEERLSTMFPRFQRGDMRARTPEVDDERGVLAAYRNHPVNTMANAGCSAAGGTMTPPLSLMLALGLLALRTRRRPARARPPR